MNWTPRPNSTDERIIQHVYHENGYEMPDDMTDQFVIDIGANIGTFSVLCAERGARVFCIEPERENFQALLSNIEASKISTHYIPIRAALSYSNAGLDLYIHSSNTGAHSTITDVSDVLQPRMQFVAGLTLKTIIELSGFSTIDVLKLDCEGAELHAWDTVLLLHSRIKRIVCELHYERDEQLAIAERLDPFYTARNIFQADWSFDHR